MIGKLLRDGRKRQGLTQREVADKLGFQTCQFISNLERGLAEIPAYRILDFAKVLDLDPGRLTNLVGESLKHKKLKDLAVEYQPIEDPFIKEVEFYYNAISESDRALFKTMVTRLM